MKMKVYPIVASPQMPKGSDKNHTFLFEILLFRYFGKRRIFHTTMPASHASTDRFVSAEQMQNKAIKKGNLTTGLPFLFRNQI